MFQFNECVITRRQSFLVENLVEPRIGYKHIGQEVILIQISICLMFQVRNLQYKIVRDPATRI